MNEVLNHFTKLLSNITLSLKKKNILINKPWVLIDADGNMQKFIFKQDKGFLLSRNGLVSYGSWDYFPEARSLLIDTKEDKILLNEYFIDHNVLILKRDGTNNELFALANENALTYFEIPDYLNSLKINEYQIKEVALLNGNTLHIYNGTNKKYLRDFTGLSIEVVNDDFNSAPLKDGTYISKDKKQTYFIEGNKIRSVKNNVIKKWNDQTFEIVDGNRETVFGNKNKLVTINGEAVPSQRLIYRNAVIYINDGLIETINMLVNYELKNGYIIIVEQKNYDKLSNGDRIVDSKPISPIPDGSYRIKGKWKKIRVVDNVVQ